MAVFDNLVKGNLTPRKMIFHLVFIFGVFFVFEVVFNFGVVFILSSFLFLGLSPFFGLSSTDYLCREEINASSKTIAL